MKTTTCFSVAMFALWFGFVMWLAPPTAGMAQPPGVSDEVLENMTRAQFHRQLDALARALGTLERKVGRLDERVDALSRELKEVKRKV